MAIADVAEEVVLQEPFPGGVVEPVVHGQVAEVEEEVAHPRVLVVHDPDVVPVAEEVGVE